MSNVQPRTRKKLEMSMCASAQLTNLKCKQQQALLVGVFRAHCDGGAPPFNTPNISSGGFSGGDI